MKKICLRELAKRPFIVGCREVLIGDNLSLTGSRTTLFRVCHFDSAICPEKNRK
jgi:hypothetical protein